MKSIFSVCINIVVNLLVLSYGKEKFDGLNSFAELADDFIELFGEEKCIFTCGNGNYRSAAKLTCEILIRKIYLSLFTFLYPHP